MLNTLFRSRPVVVSGRHVAASSFDNDRREYMAERYPAWHVAQGRHLAGGAR